MLIKLTQLKTIHVLEARSIEEEHSIYVNPAHIIRVFTESGYSRVDMLNQKYSMCVKETAEDIYKMVTPADRLTSGGLEKLQKS